MTKTCFYKQVNLGKQKTKFITVICGENMDFGLFGCSSESTTAQYKVLLYVSGIQVTCNLQYCLPFMKIVLKDATFERNRAQMNHEHPT